MNGRPRRGRRPTNPEAGSIPRPAGGQLRQRGGFAGWGSSPEIPSTPRIAATSTGSVTFSKQNLLRPGVVIYDLRLTFQDTGQVGITGVALHAAGTEAADTAVIANMVRVMMLAPALIALSA